MADASRLCQGELVAVNCLYSLVRIGHRHNRFRRGLAA